MIFAGLSFKKRRYYVSTAADPTNFRVTGTYSIEPGASITSGTIILDPSAANQPDEPHLYEITKSLLIFDKDDPANEVFYTKNSETGGGFNGTLHSSLLGGMWQNQNDRNDAIGFNNDNEYFEDANVTNASGKYWWIVQGTFSYTGQSVTVTWNKSAGIQAASYVYSVAFTSSNQVLTLTRTGQAAVSYELKTGL